MKHLLTGLVCLMLILTFTSCKKEECPAPAFPVEGYWVGKYGNGSATPGSGYSMVIEPGGTVMVADGSTMSSSSKAIGTWTLTGNVFKATYTYSGGGSTFSIQANWSSDGKLTGGTWGSGTNVSGSGTWFMDRRN
jgi:hypothetical protein